MSLQFWRTSQGIDRGTVTIVHAIIAKTVKRIGPYFGKSLVDSTLCQAQQNAAKIINRSPTDDSENETAFLPNSTIATVPPNERKIPVKTAGLKCSFLVATPMRNAKIGVSAIKSAALP